MLNPGALLDQIKELRATIVEQDQTILRLRAKIMQLQKPPEPATIVEPEIEIEQVTRTEPRATLDSDKEQRDIRKSDVSQILGS